MNILYLSDILNVHDERLLSQFRAAGHSVTLLTFFHRAPELPKFVQEMGLNIIHEKYQTYPDGAGASRYVLRLRRCSASMRSSTLPATIRL